MKTIALYSGGKGGSSKTTLTMNIAQCLAMKPNEHGELNTVVVVDKDPQASILALDQEGTRTIDGEDVRIFKFGIYTDYPEKKYEDVIDYLIVDYPPDQLLIPKEDVIVYPVRPSMLDFKAMEIGFELIEKKRAKNPATVIPVVSQFHTNRSEHRGFVDGLLDVYGEVPIITSRSIYERVANRFSTVYDEFYKDVDLATKLAQQLRDGDDSAKEQLKAMREDLYGLRDAKAEIDRLVKLVLSKFN